MGLSSCAGRQRSAVRKRRRRLLAPGILFIVSMVVFGIAYGLASPVLACGTQGCPKANCVATYFYPMFYPPENKYQPNAACSGGQTLVIDFLSEP